MLQQGSSSVIVRRKTRGIATAAASPAISTLLSFRESKRLPSDEARGLAEIGMMEFWSDGVGGAAESVRLHGIGRAGNLKM